MFIFMFNKRQKRAEPIAHIFFKATHIHKIPGKVYGPSK